MKLSTSDSALKGALLCQPELLRIWIVVWVRVSLRGSRVILRIIAGNSILTTLILISQWIIFSLRIAAWKKLMRLLSAIQLTSTFLRKSARIEFHIPGTIISNICSVLIRILWKLTLCLCPTNAAAIRWNPSMKWLSRLAIARSSGTSWGTSTTTL